MKNIIITIVLILPLMINSCKKDDPLPCICEGEFVNENINDSLEISILNSFTPNGDNMNDYFGVVLNGHPYVVDDTIYDFNDDSIYLYIQNYSLSINGDVVSDDCNIGWDGGDYPSGNYQYLISFIWGNESYTYEGVISLVDNYYDNDNLEDSFSCYPENVYNRCVYVLDDPGYFDNQP